MSQEKLLEAAITEIKNDTPINMDPGWEWASTYQSVSYLANATQKLQQALFSQVDPKRVRVLLGAVIWLAQEALGQLPE